MGGNWCSRPFLSGSPDTNFIQAVGNLSARRVTSGTDSEAAGDFQEARRLAIGRARPEAKGGVMLTA
jgi:hypothetical protein